MAASAPSSTLNGPLQVTHWENLKRWQDEGLFQYGGPGGGDDAPPKFYAQECAMLHELLGRPRRRHRQRQDFEVGFGMLPYYDDVEGAPQNSIIGGATLWVLQGQRTRNTRASRTSSTYLSQPEVQADWHQDTGYLPITKAAYELVDEQGFYEENPGSDIAIKQITLNEPTENSKGLRFGNYVQIRDIIDEEFEAAAGRQQDRAAGARRGRRARQRAAARVRSRDQ